MELRARLLSLSGQLKRTLDGTLRLRRMGVRSARVDARSAQLALEDQGHVKYLELSAEPHGKPVSRLHEAAVDESDAGGWA